MTWTGLLRAAAAIAVGLWAAVPASVSASVIPAGTARLLSGLPAGLSVPADGRLNGYGFAGTVLGAATTGTFDGETAAAGQELWLVGLRWRVTPVSPPAQVATAVDANGTSTSLPLPAGAATSADTGPLYWVVSEPSHATDVTVVATSAGLSQTFSLTHLRREHTTSAPALYRTPGQWQTVVPVNDNRSLTGSGYDLATHPQLTINLQSVTFTDFGPTGPNDTPPAGSDAWLTLAISSGDPTLGVSSYSPVVAGQITLTVPGRRVITRSCGCTI